jgi:hypothetical protein
METCGLARSGPQPRQLSRTSRSPRRRRFRPGILPAAHGFGPSVDFCEPLLHILPPVQRASARLNRLRSLAALRIARSRLARILDPLGRSSDNNTNSDTPVGMPFSSV